MPYYAFSQMIRTHFGYFPPPPPCCCFLGITCNFGICLCNSPSPFSRLYHHLFCAHYMKDVILAVGLVRAIRLLVLAPIARPLQLLPMQAKFDVSIMHQQWQLCTKWVQVMTAALVVKHKLTNVFEACFTFPLDVAGGLLWKRNSQFS